MGQDDQVSTVCGPLPATEAELTQLERSEEPLTRKLVAAYRKQVSALRALEQYVAMFAQGEGELADVDDLVADLGEILEPVRTQTFADNVIPLPMNRTFHCIHCGKPFVTAR